MKYFPLITIIACCLISCSEGRKEHIQKYFPLGQYFRSESEHLKAQSLWLRKTILQHEHIESFTDSMPDWSKELALFASMDINKPIYADTYHVDTVQAVNATHVITQSLKPEKNTVQLIDVLYDSKQQISMITIHYQHNSAMQKTSYRLSYIPGKGYDIAGTFKSAGTGARDFDIHCEIGSSTEL